MPSPKTAQRILLVALALGWAADALFYGRSLGLSVPTFSLLLLGAIFWLGQMEGVRPVWRNMWLIGPLLFFAVMVAIRADPFLTNLNMLACLGILPFVIFYYAEGRVERLSLLGFSTACAVAWAHTAFKAAPLISPATEVLRTRRHQIKSLTPVLRGFLFALPVLAVFTTLLSSADVVFAGYVSYLLSLNFFWSLEMWWRITLVLAASWLIAGALYYALSRRNDNLEELWEGAIDDIPRSFSIGHVEAATVLASVNALFLLFGWVQFAYLFGGEANISAAGYTYAEYARRGFFELVTVSLLTLGLIIVLNFISRRETTTHVRTFNTLSSIMVALALVLLASAFWRMMLYESAYGYTHLRLYVHIFEVWLGLAFLWFLVTLWLKPRRFAIGAFVAAVGFLATLNLINPDAYIVEQNLTRYRETGNLDLYYLTRVSIDGVPALVKGLGELPVSEQQVLRENLGTRLAGLQSEAGREMSPSFNLARWQAYELLSTEAAARSVDSSQHP
jgi:hypothetical protein